MAPAPRRAADTPTPVTAAAVWDLCGLGRLPVPRGAAAARVDPEQALEALPDPLGRDALAQALEGLLAALDVGPPRWRAAAVMLRGTDGAGRPQHLALPELARAGDDPVVAMWVLQRCDRELGCAESDLQRWARIEPDNLAPWLHLLQRLPQQRDEFMARMAAATRFDWYETALIKVVLDATPPGTPAYLQTGLWTYTVGVEAALSLPAVNGVFNACREPIEPGSDAQRHCSAIARTLAERSDSVIGASLGLRLAERTYMTKADAASRRAALQAQLVASEGPPDPQPLSCAGVARRRAWVEQRAQLGELGALRAQAAARAASTPR